MNLCDSVRICPIQRFQCSTEESTIKFTKNCWRMNALTLLLEHLVGSLDSPGTKISLWRMWGILFLTSVIKCSSLSVCWPLTSSFIYLLIPGVLPVILNICKYSLPDMRRDVQEIFKMTPHDKQVMMFSATLSKEIRPVCKKFMQDVISYGQYSLGFQVLLSWIIWAHLARETCHLIHLVSIQ